MVTYKNIIKNTKYTHIKICLFKDLTDKTIVNDHWWGSGYYWRAEV